MPSSSRKLRERTTEHEKIECKFIQLDEVFVTNSTIIYVFTNGEIRVLSVKCKAVKVMLSWDISLIFNLFFYLSSIIL